MQFLHSQEELIETYARLEEKPLISGAVEHSCSRGHTRALGPEVGRLSGETGSTTGDRYGGRGERPRVGMRTLLTSTMIEMRVLIGERQRTAVAKF